MSDYSSDDDSSLVYIQDPRLFNARELSKELSSRLLNISYRKHHPYIVIRPGRSYLYLTTLMGDEIEINLQADIWNEDGDIQLSNYYLKLYKNIKYELFFKTICSNVSTTLP